MRHALFIVLLFAGCRTVGTVPPPSESTPTSLTDVTQGMTRIPGFVPIWWGADEHRVLLELPEPGVEFLYWISLPAGLGSNDVGLDRGQVGDRWLLQTWRSGDRVLLMAPNLSWRSSSKEVAVQTAVDEAFAKSAIYGFELVAESEGRLLVDATDFLLRDAHGIANKLERSGQGAFHLEATRSALLNDGLLAFPNNSQIDALLTFSSDSPGGEVQSTASDAHSVSLQVRHNFVALPDANFKQRPFHPRSGFWEFSWNNLSAQLGEPLSTKSLVRHRLQKSDQSDPGSPVIEPIVYYIDRGAPEPIRTALLEGARYWQPVFAAAGFPDGFRAELLPQGADIHDVRYNVVQWANRSTRGWSYGNAVTDPRTGEIIKGHVTLGALRVRQDLLLADGLLSPYANESDARSQQMALARIRQLAAHEIGHTLGLAHNFAASTDGRASVMDYPAPLIALDGASGLDLSQAYRDGCGEWDKLAIRYGYSEFESAEEERVGLQAILEEARRRGLDYLTDRDARGADRAHPLANLWDNGADPVAYLDHEIEVRRRALANFDSHALRSGRALAELEEVLIPVYLHHRYQVEAAARSIAGVNYSYELVGEGQRGLEVVAAADQRRALASVLATLEPSFLALPDSIRKLIPPRPPGFPSQRELLRPGALLFDLSALAAASIEISLDLLFNSARATRLVDQARRDPNQLSWQQLVDRVVTLSARTVAPDLQTNQEVLRTAVWRHLMQIDADDSLPARVRGPVHRALHGLLDGAVPDSLEFDILRRFFEDQDTVLPTLRAAHVPPGSPIGCGSQW